MFLLCQLVVSYNNDNDLRMWYTKPASKMGFKSEYLEENVFGSNKDNDVWQQNTLPIGNGFIGANLFGEIQTERLNFNEKTLWKGGPSKSRPNYNGGNNANKGKYGAQMKEIQDLFEDGKDKEASHKCDNLVGDSDGYGSYISWGEINFDFPFTESQASDYLRYLDLDKAVAGVEFKVGNSLYKREYLVSYPHNVLAIKFSVEGGDKLNFDARFSSKNQGTSKATGSVIDLSGEVADNQMKYDSQLLVKTKDGSVTADGEKLTIKDATEAYIYISAKTDFKYVYPTYRSGETMEQITEQVSKLVNAAADLGYDKVKEAHIKDHQSLFNRVELNLNHVPSTVSTDVLLAQYKKEQNKPEEDRDLEILLFQYGRYLTLGSSREKNVLPSNLQGVWNDLTDGVPWSSDYHMNINLQMNYFPTYNTDLHECAIPLLDYVDGLRIPGRITASIYAGINSTKENPENGFMAHTQNTPFGWTCPGWAFSWGWSPAAVPWILHNCYEYYEYTKDIKVLREKIYPMLREEAVMYAQMVKYENKTSQFYISSPTYSPEQGPYTNGNIYEQQLIWQLFTNSINAANTLGVDQDKVKQWSDILNKLKPPVQIGDSGQIKEWFTETTLGSMGSKGHRHMSHLLGLYPLNLINIDTPEWMDAAIISLIDRTDSSTGWGMGQRINAWARTGNGTHAHALVKNLLKNGIYNNLWDTHPPFQIDGNFAATSGITEMLIQSNLKEIHILPAIPELWATGYYKGLIGRGNFQFNVSWANMKLKSVSVKARSGGNLKLYYPNIARGVLKNSKDANMKFNIIDENRIEFDTEVNGVYTIDSVPEVDVTKSPKKVYSYRISASKVLVQWTPIKGFNKYTISRQIGSNVPEVIAQNVEGTKYIDESLPLYAKDTKYYVSISHKALKSVAQTLDIRRLNVVDDTDAVLKYNGRWMLLHKDDYTNKTVHYLERATKDEFVEINFIGTGLDLHTSTGPLFGPVAIYVDGKQNEVIDLASKTVNRFTFTLCKSLENKLHTVRIVSVGDKKDIEIDGFKVHNTNAVSVIGIVIGCVGIVCVVIVVAVLFVRGKKNESHEALLSTKTNYTE